MVRHSGCQLALNPVVTVLVCMVDVWLTGFPQNLCDQNLHLITFLKKTAALRPHIKLCAPPSVSQIIRMVRRGSRTKCQETKKLEWRGGAILRFPTKSEAQTVIEKYHRLVLEVSDACLVPLLLIRYRCMHMLRKGKRFTHIVSANFGNITRQTKLLSTF